MSGYEGVLYECPHLLVDLYPLLYENGHAETIKEQSSSYISNGVKDIYNSSLNLNETIDSPGDASYLNLRLCKGQNGFLSCKAVRQEE